MWSYNNPHGVPTGRPFIDPVTGKKSVGNSEYRVADLIQASTAAPTYFTSALDPDRRGRTEGDAGKNGMGPFVDGGLSPYNNPSLLLS